MDSIPAYGTWILRDLPPGCKPIGCKWIFKKKLKPDRSIYKHKVRLVAKGYSQKEWLYYLDTYLVVISITTIQVFIALVVAYNLVLHQMDVKTTFLYGVLEEVQIVQPKGFVILSQGEVCKLARSLYSLKQASKQHNKFTTL